MLVGIDENVHDLPHGNPRNGVPLIVHEHQQFPVVMDVRFFCIAQNNFPVLAGREVDCAGHDKILPKGLERCGTRF